MCISKRDERMQHRRREEAPSGVQEAGGGGFAQGQVLLMEEFKQKKPKRPWGWTGEGRCGRGRGQGDSHISGLRAERVEMGTGKRSRWVGLRRADKILAPKRLSLMCS